MGLDQSIYTTSKAIAQAIYEGNTPNGKWSTACFSPKNLEGVDEWTGFDTYAHCRLQQDSEENYSNQLFTFIRFDSPNMDNGIIGSEERAETLKFMEDVGTPNGVVAACGSKDAPEFVRNYQIGLFRKCNALHGWMCRRARTEIGSDEFVGFNAGTLRALRHDCQRVLDAFAKGQHKGEKVAKRVFPTCQGFFFGDYGYDESYVDQVEMLLDFADTILTIPVPTEEENGAFLFAYSPWY